MQTYNLQSDAMFTYEAALILNRFQMMARLIELSDGQEQQDAREEDRAARDQKERDRRAYVERGVKNIERFERRARGDK